MTTTVRTGHEATIEAIKEHLGELTKAVDLQASGIISRPGARVIDARDDGYADVTLVCQGAMGEVFEQTRKHYLPNGDDGSSFIYQVEVLEQLALEHAAVRKALERAEAAHRLLDNPPEPAK